MLNFTVSKEDLEKRMNTFIWTYKIGDNILYNLEVIFQLAGDHNVSIKGQNYAKPISVLCISVIEAILVDFLERLDKATNHFPKKLAVKRAEIKKELHNQQQNAQTVYEGKVYKYKRLKNFGFKDLVEFCEKFDILGPHSATYNALQDLGRFRNRVHIRNYFGNFEKDESQTFSEKRTQQAINYMIAVFIYIGKNYPRP